MSSNTAALVAELRGVRICPSAQRDIMNRAADALSAQAKELEEARQLARNADGDLYRDLWKASSKNVGRVCGVANRQREALDATTRERDEALAALKASEAREMAIAAAIGSVRFMDPPDGGDVSLAEQVRRMRQALETAELALKPFSAFAEYWDGLQSPDDRKFISVGDACKLTVGDLRRARAVLSTKEMGS